MRKSHDVEMPALDWGKHSKSFNNTRFMLPNKSVGLKSGVVKTLIMRKRQENEDERNHMI